jgi:hypothetical protein
MSARFPQPFVDRFLARWNSGIANTTVLGNGSGKGALAADRANPHAVSVAFEQEPVALSDAKSAANFDGHRDLAFARDFGLLLHRTL